MCGKTGVLLMSKDILNMVPHIFQVMNWNLHLQLMVDTLAI